MRVCCSFINWDPEPSASKAHSHPLLLQALPTSRRHALFGLLSWRLLRGHAQCRAFLGGFLPQMLLLLSGNYPCALDVHKLAPSFVCFILSCSEDFSTLKFLTASRGLLKDSLGRTAATGQRFALFYSRETVV